MIRRPLLALITLIFLAFSSSIPNEWIWDDNDYVTENPVLTEPGGLGDIWTVRDSIPQWYPLVHTTFWLEAHGPGRDAEGNLRPWVFHLTNVLLHIAGALFLLKLLVQLGFPSGAAWFLAALWAVHPVNVESVAWVTERKNVLSLLLALMSASYFLRWESAGQNRALVKCVVAFVGALLSKTVVASMPAVLMLLLWWRKRPLNLKMMLPLGAMLVVGGWMGLMTAMDEVAFVGAEGAKWDHSWAERSLIAGRAVWFYAGKALLPYPLLFVYERWDIQVEDWVQWLYPAAALLLLTVALVGIRRWGRGPLAALLVFGGVLFPALGFLDVFPHQYSFVADHFQYHALPALVVLLGALFLRIFPLGETWKSWLPHATLLLALGVVSHVQSHLYENEKVLWTDVSKRNPSAAIAWNNLALIVEKEGDGRLAREYLRKSIGAGNDNVQALNNLGQLLLKDGLGEEARPLLERAIKLEPKYVKPYVNLGDYWRVRGQRDRDVSAINQAIQYYEGANRRNLEAGGVTIPQVSMTAGQLYTALGKPKLALDKYAEAAQVPAFHEQATTSMVYILATHPNPTVRDGQRAVSLSEVFTRRATTPQALDARACALAELGRFEEAIQLARQAAFRAMETKQDSFAGTCRAHIDRFEAQIPIRTKAGLP